MKSFVFCVIDCVIFSHMNFCFVLQILARHVDMPGAHFRSLLNNLVFVIEIRFGFMFSFGLHACVVYVLENLLHDSLVLMLVDSFCSCS